MRDFEPVIYRSYAEFFKRRFRPGARSFPSTPTEMGSFAEARYFGWEQLGAGQNFPIKGHSLKPDLILGNNERAEPFWGGPVLLARLSPVDYHHVHYFDGGKTLSSHRIGGRLWTVHWKALQNKDDIIFRNERNINLVETQNFGKLAIVEVGAMTVGRIIQVHSLDQSFCRGEEKSVFDFGGSAVVVFGEPGRWRPCDDILMHTRKGIETLVQLGDTVARASNDEQNVGVGAEVANVV